MKTTPENDILGQYHDALARMIVEQLRPVLESFTSPSCSVQQRLFDVDQAAVYLGRTPQAVRLLLQRGRIPATKIDGKVQVDRVALDELISNCTFREV